MRLSPMRRGIAGAIGLIMVIAGLLTFSAARLSLGMPSAELLWTLAQVGVGLLIAYSVALASAEKDLSRRGTRESHEDWLGFVTGCGVCGFAGIALALITASDLDAGHTTSLDRVGLWCAVSGIGMLGIVVAILPILSYEWRKD